MHANSARHIDGAGHRDRNGGHWSDTGGLWLPGGVASVEDGIAIARRRAKANAQKVSRFARGAAIGAIIWVILRLATGCASIPTHGTETTPPDAASRRCYIAATAGCAAEAVLAPPCETSDIACIAARAQALLVGGCIERWYLDCIKASESWK